MSILRLASACCGFGKRVYDSLVGQFGLEMLDKHTMTNCYFDMIHDNPGEAPFDTAFRDPRYLKPLGFNGQAFKHINTVATFESVAPGVFPATPEESRWLEEFRARRRQEITAAKAAGLKVYYHIDLFVLPKRIADHFAHAIRDPQTGRISVDCPMTLELHRAMFEEIFRDYPEVDGFIVRVGETYLYDTPYHVGDGAVHYHLDNPVEEQIRQFAKLLCFLREEICVKNGRLLFHRTWDVWPNRFHASADFYLRVTDQVEPHPKLLFSIKHTVLDFHRWVEFNPCLTLGQHRQVVEVQCQREYEGKGAYPNYSTHGVIEGFAEQRERKGLKDIIRHPLLAGVYTWSRGGGWYGPYVTRANELWCDLNTYVIAQWSRAPERSEESVFMEYARERLGMRTADAAIFRRIALDSLDAVLKGKCCAAYDGRDKDEPTNPTQQWMRDDRLHGMDRLEPVFDYLNERDALEDALAEKWESVRIWERMRTDCDAFSAELDPTLRDLITGSVEYGLRLFRAIAWAWTALGLARARDTGREAAVERIEEAANIFGEAWAEYSALPEDHPCCASLYLPEGWCWPGKEPVAGLAASLQTLGSRVPASLAKPGNACEMVK